MKALGLRSVDSMLKRNSAHELYIYAKHIESKQWQSKFTEKMKRMAPSDFDTHPIEPIVVSAERANKLRTSQFPMSQLVTPNYETGAILVIAPPRRFNLDSLAVVLALLESVSELKKHSAYFRSISVRPDFAERVLGVLTSGLPKLSKRNHATWSSFYRHLVGNEAVRVKIEQPHIVASDFAATPATDILANVDSELAFWSGGDYVFYVDTHGNHVSMHVVDVVTNASNKLPYSMSRADYGRARLKDELHARYLNEQQSFEEIIDEFLYDQDL